MTWTNQGHFYVVFSIHSWGIKCGALKCKQGHSENETYRFVAAMTGLQAHLIARKFSTNFMPESGALTVHRSELLDLNMKGGYNTMLPYSKSWAHHPNGAFEPTPTLVYQHSSLS